MIVAKDIELIGSLASPNTFAPSLALMESGRIDVKPLITQVYPIEKTEDAIKMIMDKKEFRLKVLLEI